MGKVAQTRIPFARVTNNSLCAPAGHGILKSHSVLLWALTPIGGKYGQARREDAGSDWW